MTTFRRPGLDAVQRLLAEAGLPADDLSGELEHFFGCGDPRDPTGIVGLEIYERSALLRSLVVSPAARGRGCGKALVAAAERYARQQSVESIYLLTETAWEFFGVLGYLATERASVPAAIQSTSEFSQLCPASATLMVKRLA